MIGVAIVGAGVIGQRLSRAVAEAAAAGVPMAVVAVCDVNEPAAAALAKKCGATTVTKDFKDLLKLKDVTVVYVGVPPQWHKEIAEASLEAGRHVLCEKPLALSAADADHMAATAAAAAARGLCTTVNLPFRQMSPVWAMQKATAADGSGFVGKPRRVNLRFRFPLWPRAWQVAPWVGRRKQGGPLREVGTHFYFLMQELFGGVTRIRATVDFPEPAGEDGDGPCEVSALGEFETRAGVRGSLDLLTGVAGDEEVVARVYGTAGTVTLTGWTELTGLRVQGAAKVSTSGAYERKEGGPEASDAVEVLDGRDAMRASPEALLLRGLAASIDAAAAKADAPTEAGAEVGATSAGGGAAGAGAGAAAAAVPEGTAPLVTFQQAADAQRVLDAILSSGGEWVSLE